MTCHSHGADDQSVWSETICTVISTGSQEKNECWSLVQLSFVSCLQQRIYKNCKLECSCVQECNEYLDSSAASTECPSNYHIGSNWRPATPTRPSLLVSSVAHSTALQSSPRATFVQGCVVWRLFCSLGICTTPDEAAQPRHSGCCSSGCHISGVEYLGLQLLSVAGRAGCWLQKRSRLVVRSVAGNVTSQRPLEPPNHVSHLCPHAPNSAQVLVLSLTGREGSSTLFYPYPPRLTLLQSSHICLLRVSLAHRTSAASLACLPLLPAN